MAKRLAVKAGTPFLPLAQAQLHPEPLSGANADAKFRALQVMLNGAPKQYKRKHEATLQEMIQKFEDLYAEYPPVSAEVVEAHKRLGYPKHYINALETGTYKVMMDPAKGDNGEPDMAAFKDYWSFDLCASTNIRTKEQWDKASDILDSYVKKGAPTTLVPRVDWSEVRKATRFAPGDFDILRWRVDRDLSRQLRPTPGTMKNLWREYEAADEGVLADELVDMYAEKQTEVSAMRRMALLRWMEARGDIGVHDALDFLPKMRDLESSRQDSSTPLLRFYTNEVDVVTSQEIPSWSEYTDALYATHVEWKHLDDKAALGDAVTDAALLQQRINQLMSSGSEDTSAGAAASGEKVKKGITAVDLLINKDRFETEAKAKLLPSADDAPLIMQSMMRALFEGKDWKQTYNGLLDAEKKKAAELNAAA